MTRLRSSLASDGTWLRDRRLEPRAVSRFAIAMTGIAALGAGLLAVAPLMPEYGSPTAEIEAEAPVAAEEWEPGDTEWADPSEDQQWTPGEDAENVAAALIVEATGGAEAVPVKDETVAALGISGFAVEVAAAGPGARIDVDYGDAEAAFSPGWDERASVLRLPACALITPEADGCLDAEHIAADIDTQADTVGIDFEQTSLAAAAAAEPMVLAVASTAADTSTGDFSATKLESIGSWEAGSNTGAFTYSVPISVPPAEGPIPEITLAYNSALHDGRTSGKNNQASWVGDGWTYEPGYIERTYTACYDDTGSGANNGENDFTADQCWDAESDHITVSLNGVNATLLKDDDSGTWYVDSGQAWKVEPLGATATGSSATSEYWKIITEDGSAYTFGSTTGSRLTVPVFGNHTGEPCHASEFKDSGCAQTYRWLIDKAVDTTGNMARYTYTTKTGAYGAAGDEDNRTAYGREAYLSTIEYGLREGDASVAATGKVVFTVTDRCQGDCYNAENEPIETAWPETPWDLHCAEAPCTTQFSPVFFDTKRLTSITTQVRNGSTWRDVDRWSLDYEFKTYGSENQVVLWLKSIQQTGKTGTDIALPKVEFGGYALANRVEAADRIQLWRWRMSSIKTETGAVISIGYSEPDCATLPSKTENTHRCFPVLSKPRGQAETVEDWFHKYVVTEVTQTDPIAQTPSVSTFYEYATTGSSTGVLWAWDDSAHTRKPERTYNQWRGFAQVTTRLGDPDAGPQTVTATRFYRGLDAQPLPDGAERDVILTSLDGIAVTDHEALSGEVFEEVTYNGTQIIQGAVTRYWTSMAASQDHDGGSYEAWRTGPSREDTRRWLTSDTWQRTRTDTTYDSIGRPTAVSVHGDTAKTGDEMCTRTWYTDAATANIYSLPSRDETVDHVCDATTSGPGDILTANRYYYDHHTGLDDDPTDGLLTRSAVLDSWPAGGTARYVDTTVNTYDAIGRVTETVDPAGRSTTTAYTPSGAGPVTQKTTSNDAGHATVTLLDPAWGVETKITDPNQRVTEIAYDALGRTTSVWEPGRTRASETASRTFAYNVSATAPSTVTTEELGPNGNYITTIELYDSLLRPLQTQTDTIENGRLLTLNRYDTHGRIEETRGPDYNNQAASTTLAVVERGASSNRVEITYDAAGRPTVQAQFRGQEELWRTTTAYGGSTEGYQITVTPPEGGAATATIEDAFERTAEFRTFHTGTPTGGYDTLVYDYDPLGKITEITDGVGNTWSWTYDLQGRTVASTHPDSGTTLVEYNDAGQITAIDDAREETGQQASGELTIELTYDDLGRLTERRDGTGTLLASWSYDTAEGGIGLLAASNRHLGDDVYTETVTYYDEGGRVGETEIAIPDAEGGLAGYYYVSQAYHDNGQLLARGYSPAGGIGTQDLFYYYDEVGNQTSLLSEIDGDAVAVVDDATYTPYGEIQTRRLNSSYNNKFAYQGYDYEETTRRLERFTFDHQTTDPTVADLHYTYDDAGNIQSVADLPADDANRWETQCFNYDGQQRITEAWAQEGDAACTATGDQATLGGPAMYHNTYTYDASGNRSTDSLLLTGNGGETRTYTYPTPGSAKSHAPTQVASEGGTMSYFTYDAAGNLLSRDVGGSLTTFEWNTEGHNTSTSNGDLQTRMVYDADGARVIRDDGDTATLYLPDTEIVWDKEAGTLDTTRYIQHAGAVIAACKGNSMDLWRWVGADPHGTATHSVNAVSHSGENVRYFDPFGLTRGERNGEWFGQQGYVGATEDPTGLLQMGARTYDPQFGRFIEVDPLLVANDKQQLTGYVYAANNPIGLSDSTGMFWGLDDIGEAAGDAWGSVKDAAGAAWDATSDFAVDVWNGEYNAEIGGILAGAAVIAGCAAIGVATLGIGGLLCAAGAGAIAGGVTSAWNGNDTDQVIHDSLVGALWGVAGWGVGWALSRLAAPATGSVADDLLPDGSAPSGPGRTSNTSSAGATSCNSFVPGTSVVMADGTYKPIEAVAEGEYVLAADPTTGKIEAAEVEETTVTQETDRDLISIVLGAPAEEPDGEEIEATAGHSFWAAAPESAPSADDAAKWIAARDLEVGSWLQSSDGTWTRIVSLEERSEETEARNLAVDGSHTYFVTDGVTDTLVHNCSLSELAKSWVNRTYRVAGDNYTLNWNVMKHFLQRHHPSYYAGGPKAIQSFLPGGTSVGQIKSIIGSVLAQNRGYISRLGGYGKFQLPPTTIGGNTFIVSIQRSSRYGFTISQFYMK
ncbi:intein C-terminal splicing region/RHS repeat-associated core domain-containing protein [Glycomyces harbinensis]|uniref:Intein C-terminal splicing region/RHS repeat-associated core domain-containing protein n=2 Tax=Glycomyces harbinensis TaxID=58114 RepID=A0A1G6SI72_9ACTN|nr:intein C-terminal splicing region/RHS repeat-associated core domain-containing protein [Glycomyces harbinensis]